MTEKMYIEVQLCYKYITHYFISNINSVGKQPKSANTTHKTPKYNSEWP